MESTLVEIKIVLAINTHEELEAIANRIGNLKLCMIGDSTFKYGMSNYFYRV